MTHVSIIKASDELRTVWGWASVVQDEAGRPIIDRQGDIIPPVELQKAAHGYLLHSRDGGVMHEETGVATIVESFVTLPEVIKALFPTVPEGRIPVGWVVAFRVHDEAVWKRVKDGELRAFSIHGVGQSEDLEVAG